MREEKCEHEWHLVEINSRDKWYKFVCVNCGGFQKINFENTSTKFSSVSQPGDNYFGTEKSDENKM